MKRVFLLLLFMFSCENFYGDKNLGGDFYYMVEPAFNLIYIPNDLGNPYALGPTVIKNIEELGYNKEYILASTKNDDSINYYLIDKILESKRDYQDRLKGKTNLKALDSIKFEFMKVKYGIETKAKEEYWKEDGWK